MNQPGAADAPGRPHDHAHDALAAELRALAQLALERLDVIVTRASSLLPDQQGTRATADRQPRTPADGGRGAGPRTDGAPQVSEAHDVAACPVCAVLASLRGERAELAGHLAEHATSLLVAVRSTLGEGHAAAADTAADGTRPGRTVQHIPVERVERVERVTVERERSDAGGGAPC